MRSFAFSHALLSKFCIKGSKRKF